MAREEKKENIQKRSNTRFRSKSKLRRRSALYLEVNVESPELVQHLGGTKVVLEHFEEFGEAKVGPNVSDGHQTLDDRDLYRHREWRLFHDRP